MLNLTKYIFLVSICANLFFLCRCTTPSGNDFQSKKELVYGNERLSVYLPLLKGKQVGLVTNHSSKIGQKHLLDTLLELDVEVVKIFSPEHGFRGDASAGEYISDEKDKKTGLPVVSLYGNKKKPTRDDLMDVDILLFDIQDVGVRYYTYLSTMHYIMEAGSENNIPVVVLDRPNPNGFYIDGPILEESYTSFVGLHPVPIVYGMTIGEYAMMINGEGWLKDSLVCELHVISLIGYERDSSYNLQQAPSPNLQTHRSVLLYPSLGWFEGTIISVARGTDFPFEAYGNPDYPDTSFSFVPKRTRAATNPPYKGKVCYGQDLRILDEKLIMKKAINLDYLKDAYEKLNTGESFFNSFFYNLSGTNQLRKDIISGKNGYEIRESWEQGLNAFKKVRVKYLIYPDF